MRDAERVGRIGLVTLCRHRRPHIAGLQADRLQPKRQQFRVQPRRQGAGLVTHPPQPR